MSFFKKLFSKYKSPKQLKIYKGQIRYTIYEMILEGKSHEEIYEAVRANGGFQNESKKEALNYIEYFSKQMLK